MRKAIAAVLFAVAGAALLLAVFAFTALFDEYEDSADSVYVGWAVITLVVAAAAGTAGAVLLRERR